MAKLPELAMSQLEQRLKECFSLRPDLQDHILSAQELSEYLRWLVMEFGGKPGYTVTASSVFDGMDNRMADLGTRLLKNPKDQQALQLLSEGYDNQREDRYIMSNHDISIARMFRYMPAHWHGNDYFEMYYSFSGDCPVHFLNEVIHVKPGTVLIVAPAVVHANPCYHDDQVLFYYMLRRSSFDKVFWNLLPPENLMVSFFRQALSGKQPNSYLQFETGQDETIRDLMVDIYEEFRQGDLYRAQMLNTLMSEFFIMLLRRYEGTARLPRTDQFYWKHEFSAILSYIQTHYATVRQSELAERFHYSDRQIGRIIQSVTGMTYAQLITKLRMEQAAAMLKEGDFSIEAISLAVGYANTSSFHRAFLGYHGCTPGKYMTTRGT